MRASNVTGLRHLTQHSLLKRSVSANPGRVALVDVRHGYRKETYQELWDRSNRLGNALMELGIKKGEKIAFWTEDRLEHVEIWYAASKIGAIWTPVNAQYVGREAEYIINHSDAVVLFLSPAFVDKVNQIREKLKNIKHYIVFGENEVDGMQRYEELLARASDENPDVEVNDDDFDSLVYTSGTTGTPCGSLRTHSSGIAWEMGVLQMMSPKDGDRFWAWYPNYHWGGCVSTRPVLSSGGTRYIPMLPDARDFLEALEKEKINKVLAIASIGEMICNHPDINKYDTSIVENWTSSGSVWQTPMREKVHEHFPNAKLVDLYSSTEAFFAWAAHDEVLSLERCSGFPALGHEMKILDGNGKELPANNWGLLCIRGMSVHDGYYKQPEKTKKSFIAGDWFTAEDVGYKDEEGRIYVSDRAKDIINTGGETMYPAEVEGILLEHPDVVQCAVVGSPDPVFTERVTAVIVTKPGVEGTEQLADQIKEYCRDKMAAFKLPRRIDFVKEIPMVGSGKVDKKKIRGEYWKEEKFKV